VEFDTRVKVEIYRAFALDGRPPWLEDVARQVDATPEATREAYARLAASRLLVLEPDGQTIRMAPPFSGVPTDHRVRSFGVEYFANCAWDALGIPAALKREAEVRSGCAQSATPMVLRVGRDGPEPSSWLFHCLVPAARWWKDIVFT
jgi:hypothetical protein